MSKPFFEVFPKLKVRKELKDYFEDTRVERLTANRERTRLKVCLHSEHLIHKDQVFRMQKEMEDQLFEGRRVEVYVEEHYSLSSLYTPRKLMEEYGDSISCEISSFSPVMGVFFRDARISYGDSGEIEICMRDSCISRSLRDRLEEALNRIFRDRCGVPATLTVTLDLSGAGGLNPSGSRSGEPVVPGNKTGISNADGGNGSQTKAFSDSLTKTSDDSDDRIRSF